MLNFCTCPSRLNVPLIQEEVPFVKLVLGLLCPAWVLLGSNRGMVYILYRLGQKPKLRLSLSAPVSTEKKIVQKLGKNYYTLPSHIKKNNLQTGIHKETGNESAAGAKERRQKGADMDAHMPTPLRMI